MVSLKTRQEYPSGLVSIAEAAARVGLSRRTIERWIRDRRLMAIPSEADRRQRLVELADVGALARRTTRSRTPLHAADGDVDTIGSSDVSSDSSPSPATSRSEPTNDEYQDLVDQVLQLSYSHIHRLVSQTCPWMFEPQSLDRLRSAPLGHDLKWLVDVARGETREPKERVLSRIESVLQLLFWPAATDDYVVPRSFWDTTLGQMLVTAKYRAFDPAELVGIGTAAALLGVTRPTIYRWLEDRTLNWVRDDASGRTFVVRRDIDNLIRVARALMGAEDQGEDPEGRGGREGETLSLTGQCPSNLTERSGI